MEWNKRWALLGPGLTRHKSEVGPMAYAAESRRTQVTMSRLRRTRAPRGDVQKLQR